MPIYSKSFSEYTVMFGIGNSTARTGDNYDMTQVLLLLWKYKTEQYFTVIHSVNYSHIKDYKG